jgi:prefoldin subunit 5
MNKEESIEQLRAETERLQNQLGQYQQQLKLLQQKIDSLEHPGKTIKPTSPVLRCRKK